MGAASKTSTENALRRLLTFRLEIRPTSRLVDVLLSSNHSRNAWGLISPCGTPSLIVPVFTMFFYQAVADTRTTCGLAWRLATAPETLATAVSYASIYGGLEGSKTYLELLLQHSLLYVFYSSGIMPILFPVSPEFLFRAVSRSIHPWLDGKNSVETSQPTLLNQQSTNQSPDRQNEGYPPGHCLAHTWRCDWDVLDR